MRQAAASLWTLIQHVSLNMGFNGGNFAEILELFINKQQSFAAHDLEPKRPKCSKKANSTVYFIKSTYCTSLVQEGQSFYATAKSGKKTVLC